MIFFRPVCVYRACVCVMCNIIFHPFRQIFVQSSIVVIAYSTNTLLIRAHMPLANSQTQSIGCPPLAVDHYIHKSRVVVAPLNVIFAACTVNDYINQAYRMSWKEIKTLHVRLFEIFFLIYVIAIMFDQHFHLFFFSEPCRSGVILGLL